MIKFPFVLTLCWNFPQNEKYSYLFIFVYSLLNSHFMYDLMLEISYGREIFLELISAFHTLLLLHSINVALIKWQRNLLQNRNLRSLRVRITVTHSCVSLDTKKKQRKQSFIPCWDVIKLHMCVQVKSNLHIKTDFAFLFVLGNCMGCYNFP